MGLGKAAEAGGGQESQLLHSGPQEKGELRMAKDTVFLVPSPQEECSRQGLNRSLETSYTRRGMSPTPRASSNGDGEADSLSGGASAAVLILMAKIRWCINKHCARLYDTVKWIISQPRKLYRTSLKMGAK